MKKTLVFFFFFVGLNSSFSQAFIYKYYFDAANFLATTLEIVAIEGYHDQLGEIEQPYRRTVMTSILYDISRGDLETAPDYVNFTDIRANNNPCDQYSTFTKKTKCNNRLDYLEESYDVVRDIMDIKSKIELRNGYKAQIFEKYASICNVILKDLDRMHSDAQNTFNLTEHNYKQ